MSGPLTGVRVIEMPAIGPVPFCGMLLADLGADVLRIDRPEGTQLGETLRTSSDLLGRGKRSLVLDLKAPDSQERVLAMIDKADVLLEGFRPGAMERLGLGPDTALARNPRLVYGRMTGWGQQGPLACVAGHDINFLALTGALHAIGRAGQPPVPPLNLVADFGGGSMFLAVGVLSVLLERAQSGLGQVVDAAIVDGASSLTTLVHALLSQGSGVDDRGDNTLDGGAPWYETYCCQDGKFVSVGALEPKFFAELMNLLGVDAGRFPDHMDRSCWTELRKLLTDCFALRTRDAWCALLEGTDSCFAPVLSLTEAPRHPQLVARATFVTAAGVTQPAATPRFSRTLAAIGRPPPGADEGGAQALREWGVAP